MKKTIPPSVQPAVVAQWRERLLLLRKRLAEAPDDEWAWLWKIRANIVERLLRRYAQGGPEGEHILAVLTSPEMGAGDVLSTEPYTSRSSLDSTRLLADAMASAMSSAAPGQTQSTKPESARFRDLLQDIAAAYAPIRREHEAELERNAQAAAPAPVMEAAAEGPQSSDRAVAGEQSGIPEDEIVDILIGKKRPLAK